MSCRANRILMPLSVILATAAAASAARWDWARARRYDAQSEESPAPQASAMNVIGDWPEKVRALAAALIEEHGVPDEIVPSQLTWRNRAPWSVITVFRDAESSERPNNLLQSVVYEVPLRRWRSLNAFERGVSYEPVRRELAARSDREETNILALNLADEIIQGRRTPAEAVAFYDRTVELAQSGKSSAYMKKLLFSPLSRRYFEKDSERDLRLERELIQLENNNKRAAPSP